MRAVRAAQDCYEYRGVQIQRGRERQGFYGAFIVRFGPGDVERTGTMARAEAIVDQRLGAVDRAADLAFLLQARTGSIFGKIEQRMSAAQQRALFGRVIGKGIIVIDGAAETISNLVTVAFGQDYDYRNVTPFRAIMF